MVFFPALPNITHMGFTYGPISSNLTCISTGSPATTVTWMKDGRPLTIDGSLYQLTQNVTNRRLSTYESVLTIPDTDSDRCSYTCTVTNALGHDSQICKFTGYSSYSINCGHAPENFPPISWIQTHHKSVVV